MFIHSFNKYLMSPEYVLGVTLGSKGLAVTKKSLL